MIEAYHEETPLFIHDCGACEYLMSIKLHCTKTDRWQCADLYKQCGKEYGEGTRYLIRYSSGPADYASGVTLRSLLMYQVMVSKGFRL